MELGKLSITQFKEITGIRSQSKLKKYFEDAYALEVKHNPEYANYEYGRRKKVPIKRLAEVYKVISYKEMKELAESK